MMVCMFSQTILICKYRGCLEILFISFFYPSKNDVTHITMYILLQYTIRAFDINKFGKHLIISRDFPNKHALNAAFITHIIKGIKTTNIKLNKSRV